MYQNILLTVDLNDEASWAKALPAAIGEAKAPGATLHVVSIVPDFGVSMVGSFFPDDFEEKALAETREKLAAFCAENVPSEIEAKISSGTAMFIRKFWKLPGKSAAT